MIKNFASLVIIGTSLVLAGLLPAEEEAGSPGADLLSSRPSPVPVTDLSPVPASPPPSSSFSPGGGLPVSSDTASGDNPSPSSPSPSSSSYIAPSPTPVLITPTQEVSGGFIRYIPDKNGDMEWKLDGTTVKFLSPTCLEIMDMKATSLSAKIGYLTITVGKVLYYTDSRKAQAEGEQITVRRENMVLTGRGFLWSPNLKQIRVFEDVKVLIKEKGNLGLFPL